MVVHLPSIEGVTQVLQHCKKTGSRTSAVRLLNYMLHLKLEVHASLGNLLVCVLVSIGCMPEALDTFDGLMNHINWSWDSLIINCVKFGHPQDALEFYEKSLKNDRQHLCGRGFVALLKACTSLNDLERGIAIHRNIVRIGLLKENVFIGSALVDMYAKCDMLDKAQEVFDIIEARNVVLWTALIAGYVEHERGREALDCLEKMQQEGCNPNAVTFVFLLKACVVVEDLNVGKMLHAEIERQGLLEKDLLLMNTLLDMYAKFGIVSFAQEVFDKAQNQDVVSWTALIGGYADNGHRTEALLYFERMRLEAISPDLLASIYGLKIFRDIGAVQKGKEIHAWLEGERRFHRSLAVGNTLIDMYVKCNLLVEAQTAFDKLSNKNIVSWATLISGYAEDGNGEAALNYFKQMEMSGLIPDDITYVCTLRACASMGAMDKAEEIHADIERKGYVEKNVVVGNTLVDMYARYGLFEKALNVFDRLPVRNVISWNALITGYTDNEFADEVLKCFQQMRLEGVSPNAVTFVCSLKACGSVGAIGSGKEMHTDIERKGLLESDSLLGNTLVDMYAKCGMLAIAELVSDKLLVRDVVTWNSLLTGYAQLGESKNVFDVFGRMLGEGTKPDLVTFLMILTTCSRLGLHSMSQTFFESMSKDFGIVPVREHYSGVIDLLCRTGHLDEAVKTIKEMPKNPNLVVWRVLLSASRKWGNVGIGKTAFKNAMQSSGNDAAAYVLMSQTVASVAE